MPATVIDAVEEAAAAEAAGERERAVELATLALAGNVTAADADRLCAVVDRLSQDPDWRVRLSVARAAGRLPEPAFEALATRLMEDPQRYVKDAMRRTARSRRTVARAEARRAEEVLKVERRLERLGKKDPAVAELVLELVREKVHETTGRATHDLVAVFTDLVDVLRTAQEGLAAGPSAARRTAAALDAAARDAAIALSTVDDLRCYSDPNPPVFDRVSLASVVDQALELARQRMQRRPSPPRVRQEIDVARHLVLDAPRDRLVRAVFNVIRNAFEAIEREGRVEVTARAAEGWVVLEVTDTGCGIPEAFFPYLCQPGQSIKKRTPGHDCNTGWGTAITKRVVERDCRGRLTFKSKRGAGTTVRIELPLEQRAATAAGDTR